MLNRFFKFRKRLASLVFAKPLKKEAIRFYKIWKSRFWGQIFWLSERIFAFLGHKKIEKMTFFTIFPNSKTWFLLKKCLSLQKNLPALLKIVKMTIFVIFFRFRWSKVVKTVKNVVFGETPPDGKFPVSKTRGGFPHFWKVWAFGHCKKNPVFF